MTEANEPLESIDQLIEGCLKGNSQSQTRLYNLLLNKMFVVCLRYCSNREEAEEVLQEGFMKMFDHMHQFKFEGSFEGWVRKIMVNCALQKYRTKRHLRVAMDIDAAEDIGISADDVTSHLGTKELMNLVQQLPPAYRMVFNLYVFEGMKHREIADLLKISEGTSKSNLSDARQILQKAIKANLQYSQQNYN